MRLEEAKAAVAPAPKVAGKPAFARPDSKPDYAKKVAASAPSAANSAMAAAFAKAKK